MKATLQGLSALLLAAVAASSSFAQLPCPSCSSQRLQYMPAPMAPSYTPGFYGTPYAPNYYGGMPGQPYGGVQPPCIPFGGCGGCGGCGNGCGGIMGFPVHQFARSPRDYFMMDIECCGAH
jgi:hypothetical protein